MKKQSLYLFVNFIPAKSADKMFFLNYTLCFLIFLITNLSNFLPIWFFSESQLIPITVLAAAYLKDVRRSSRFICKPSRFIFTCTS